MGSLYAGNAKSYSHTLEREVDDLATLTGLPTERLRPVISKTARIAVAERSSRVVFMPSLRTAVSHLPPQDAVSLYEVSDLDDLAWRELLIRRLKTTSAIHSKADLDAFLARLIRRNISNPGGHSIHDPDLAAWTSYYGRFIYRGNTCSVSSKSYPTIAPQMPEELRLRAYTVSKVFPTLIVSVAERLRLGLSGEDRGEAVLSDCLRLIEHSLSTDDSALLLAIDRSATGYDVFTGRSAGSGHLPVAGGLTDLLEVIGHVTEEISVGICDRTTAALGDLVDRRFRGLPRLRISHLYQALGCGRGYEANFACDTFYALREQYSAHWSTYRDQLQQMFDGPTDDYYAAANATASIATTHIPSNLAPLDLLLRPEPNIDTIASILTQDVQFAFYNFGDIWIIKYDGQAAALTDQRGLEYISILLHTPHRDVTAVSLAQAVGSISVNPEFTDEYRRLQELEMMSEGISEENSQHLWADTERIRKSVSAAINRARGAIEAKCPTLSRHLRNTLDIGHTCRYQPEPRLPWIFG